MRVRHTLSAFALAAAAFLAPISAGAAVVHDNGPFATGGWRLDARLVADDFTFQSTTSFNTIRFWALVDGGSTPSYDGFISWQIYDNGASGAPGNILASGSATPTPQFVTTESGFDIYVLEFGIPEVTLPASTSYLALHSGPLSEFDLDDNLLWATVQNPANPNAVDIKTLLSPIRLETDVAFQLLQVDAVPEPMSAALLGSGILALGIAARRRRT